MPKHTNPTYEDFGDKGPLPESPLPPPRKLTNAEWAQAITMLLTGRDDRSFSVGLQLMIADIRAGK